MCHCVVMRFRSSPWPRCSIDWCALLFLLGAVGLTFIVHVSLVMPALFAGPLLWLHLGLALFVLYNILGNLVACMVVDSSTRGLLMPATCPPGWHFCAACEATAPPRSWHCDICGACVLRRDHHCLFSGSCVGHCNARFFFMLLFYLCLGAGYTSVLNTLHVVRILGGFGTLSIWQLMMPLAALLWTGSALSVDSSAANTPPLTQLHALLLSLDFIGGLFVCALFFYHSRNAFAGQTCREQARGVPGLSNRWQANLLQIFGTRWRWVWLSPVIDSPLPCDGVKYDSGDSSRARRDNIISGGDGLVHRLWNRTAYNQ